MAVMVKGIRWNERGWGSTPVGLSFLISEREGSVLLERFDMSLTTKSIHDSASDAKAFAFKKYQSQVMDALDLDTP